MSPFIKIKYSFFSGSSCQQSKQETRTETRSKWLQARKYNTGRLWGAFHNFFLVFKKIFREKLLTEKVAIVWQRKVKTYTFSVNLCSFTHITFIFKSETLLNLTLSSIIIIWLRGWPRPEGLPSQVWSL